MFKMQVLVPIPFIRNQNPWRSDQGIYHVAGDAGDFGIHGSGRTTDLGEMMNAKSNLKSRDRAMCLLLRGDWFWGVFLFFLVIGSQMEKHDSWKSILALTLISHIIWAAVMLEETDLTKALS